MKHHHFLACFIIFAVLGLASCASPDERINTQFDNLPQADSTLLYKYGDASSSATGECSGVFQHRWYGTATSKGDVEKFYTDYLTDNGWSVWSGEAVEIWSQKESEGLYRIGVTVFTDPGDISQEQGSYQLPKTVWLEAS